MSCERFREAIAGHAAGAEITGAAAAHLTSCDSCRAEAERQRRLIDEVDAELGRTLAITASPEFVACVTSRATATSDRSIAWRPVAVWGGLAAAAAIAVASFLRAPAPAPIPVPREAAIAAPLPPTRPAIAESTARSAPVREPLIRREQSRPTARLRGAQEPPVMVGRDQVDAIVRLQELLSEGRLTAKMLPRERPHEALALTVAPLEIPEIKVPDIESVRGTPGSAAEQEPKEQR